MTEAPASGLVAGQGEFSLCMRKREIMGPDDRYQAVLEAMDDGFCIIEMIEDASGRPVDYRFLEVNAAFERQTGLVDAVGKCMRTLEPQHEDHWFETYGRVAATGQPARFELPARHLDNRIFEVFALRVGVPDRRQVAIVFRDVSARKRLEEERATLLGELNHRVKNVFAVVRALAVQGGGDGSAGEYQTAFLGRLDALIRSHNLALDGQVETVGLKTLADVALAPYARPGGAGCTVHGEMVELESRAVLALSMVLHELATNAAKYGALSVDTGHVDLSWRRQTSGEGGAVVHLEWRETNGPPVRPPARQGFGTRLISHIFAHDLGGAADLAFPAEGLCLRASFPVP